MERREKISLAVFTAVIALAATACAFVFDYKTSHSTWHEYNDRYIMDRPRREIEKRYGEFDVSVNDTVGYYIYTDKDSGEDYYYLMDYDPKDKVRKIYIGKLPE